MGYDFRGKKMKSHNRSLQVLLLVFTMSAGAFAQTPADSDRQNQIDTLVAKAIGFLKARGQLEDGSFSSASAPGVTALVTAGLLRNGVSPDDPAVRKSLKYLEGLIHNDGGIYLNESTHKNYETSLAILCFKEANADGRYTEVLERGSKFIQGLQWDGGEGKEESDYFYGGAGYGRHGRPDLSNTSFMVDALVAAGEEGDSEALQRALLFISRTQNLESEHNTTPFPNKNPDGGFYYTPANGGESQAGETANGGLRSYASMTYAGLKSMIYAGVDKDDARVKAAYAWLQKHYDLKSNPGMGTAGLYYYYHTFAKALNAMDSPVFIDDEGEEHDWRMELIDELASRQQDNGSWLNDENGRWLEDNASLVTGYAILALSYCR